MQSRSAVSMSREDDRIAKCAALRAGCRPPLPVHQEGAIRLLNLFVALSKISNRHRTFSLAAVNSRIHLCHKRQVLTSDPGGDSSSTKSRRQSPRVRMFQPFAVRLRSYSIVPVSFEVRGFQLFMRSGESVIRPQRVSFAIRTTSDSIQERKPE